MRCVTLVLLSGVGAESPVPRVTELIVKLKATIEADGKKEQALYDESACWFEKTMASKIKEIDQQKDQLTKLGTEIEKRAAQEARSAVEIKQHTKDIAENEKSQKEALELRQKEHKEYLREKQETEQCIGALGKATRVLNGAGRGIKKTTLLGVVGSNVAGDLRYALHMAPPGMLSPADRRTVNDFIDHAKFYQSGGVADYAPQSTAIGGILKNMFETFSSDLEVKHADEAKAQRSSEELLAAKKRELKDLQDNLLRRQKENALAGEVLASSKIEREEISKALKDNEAFFADIKAENQARASSWAERTRLRTEELGGINQALKVLQDPENIKIFEESAKAPAKADKPAEKPTGFIQLHRASPRATASALLQRAASARQNLRVAELATKLQAGGHFDRVIVEIEKMIQVLRDEESEDIRDRDRCDEQGTLNKYRKEDLATEISRLDTDMSKHETRKTSLEAKQEENVEDVKKQKKLIKDAKDARAESHNEFVAALQDDEKAIALIEAASDAMTRFYKANNIKMSMLQDPEDGPPAGVGSGAYGGRQGASRGIIGLLSIIKSDIQKEIEVAKADEKTAEAEFEKMSLAAQRALRDFERTAVRLKATVADIDADLAELKDQKSTLEGDQTAVGKTIESLKKSCDWVKTNFESRRTKRADEMEGLESAKSILAGASPEGLVQK